MDAFEILVIILSVTLAAFLILGIITLSLLIGLIRKFKDVPMHISAAATNIEDVSASIKKVALPLMLAGNFADKWFNRKK